MFDSAGAIGCCLCNKVRVTVPSTDQKVRACRCEKCMRWGGGQLSVNCGCAPSFAGDQHIAVYDSSDSAERGFCKSCGSHLFYRVKESGVYYVPAGIFNDA